MWWVTCYTTEHFHVLSFDNNILIQHLIKNLECVSQGSGYYVDSAGRDMMAVELW